ncbi:MULTISPECIES: DUF1883 domain-containing protein [Serratia]|uniref:DUF1883 domain-containing protein n=1 Tax=Serratia TaxID=613 RepID=UPI00217A8EDF|nr:DUF1883 domain-containing protein [Serratia grimesii]CAI0745037.1 Domain of uncharacterised function (DUF1883) [Serratia grimesii]
MGFKYEKYNLSAGDIVRATCSHQLNVLLMTESNFNNYRNGRRAEYVGGLCKRSPADIQVPHSGIWYVVIQSPGGGGERYSISIIST